MDDEAKDEFLKNLYYTEHRTQGRDVLFHYISKTLNNKFISRRYINNWLQAQPVHQLYRKRPTTTNIKPILTQSPNNIIQCDLIDFSNRPSAQNYRYILNCVDVFSRKCWLAPLKQKTSKAEDTALSKIIIDIEKESNFPVKALSSDRGNEFLGEVFKIFTHITSRAYTPQSQGLIERLNGSLKSILTKVLYIEKKKDWKQYLPQIQEIYNTTAHTALNNKTPDELYYGTAEEHLENFEEQKNKKAQQYKNIDTVLELNQKVRLLIQKKTALDKGGPNYSSDVYTIIKVFKANAKKFTIPRYKYKAMKQMRFLTGRFPLVSS
jgi:transposase InsO family protein